MQKPSLIIRPADMIVERHVELIMAAFDKWERRIEGTPSWDDIDRLMESILEAIGPGRNMDLNE